MGTVAAIEKQIRAVEMFDVHFIHAESKRRLHAKMEGLPEYPYTTPAPSNMSANRWRRLRFDPIYPNFSVKVLMGNGSVSRGPERLYTIRRSYP